MYQRSPFDRQDRLNFPTWEGTGLEVVFEPPSASPSQQQRKEDDSVLLETQLPVIEFSNLLDIYDEVEGRHQQTGQQEEEICQVRC